MSVLKRLRSHEKAVFIEKYLTRENRALAVDLYNCSEMDAHAGSWGNQMDYIRRINGHEKNIGKKRPVTYHHFIISPDPRDHVSLDDLRRFVGEWVEERLAAGGGGAAMYGEFQVAAAFHDDNARHIPHAHLIINATNLETGNRLHLDEAENEEVFTSLQKKSREYGWRYFDEDKGGRNTIQQADEPVQREAFSTISVGQGQDGQTPAKGKTATRIQDMRDRGAYVWSDDILARVAIAYTLSGSEPEFLRLCGTLGVVVSDSARGDYKFALKSAETRCKNGASLDKSFSKASVKRSFATGRKSSFHETTDAYKRDILSSITGTSYLHSEGVAWIVPGTGYTLSDVAQAIDTNILYDIRSFSDYDAALAGEAAPVFRKDLEHSKNVAAACGMFAQSDGYNAAPARTRAGAHKRDPLREKDTDAIMGKLKARAHERRAGRSIGPASESSAASAANIGSDGRSERTGLSNRETR